MSQTAAAQVIGIIGMLTEALSFQCRGTRKLFLFQIASSGFFVLHLFLLGAYTGALLNLAGAVRSGILFLGDRRWARSRTAMALVMLMMAACGAVTWNGWLSLLPTAAMAAGTPFLWTRSGKTVRMAMLFFISPCWLIYDIFAFSIAGILTESFNLLSILISFARFGTKGFQEDSAPKSIS